MTIKEDGNVAAMCNGDLREIVALNEDIKSVMRISNGINLAAINAMLIAKKIGRASNGFIVVSGELRIFSQRLDDAMRQLQVNVSSLVQQAAGLVRLNKAMSLQRATQSSAAHYKNWDGMLQRKSGEFERSCASIQHHRSHSLMAVSRSIKLCVMGISLSYSAKVEAVYGDAQSRALKQVSEDVEEAIGNILDTLKKIEKSLGVGI